MIEIRIPPSKSLTQRALLLAALSDRPCRVLNPLDCDDSRAMLAGLSALGAEFDPGDECWTIRPPAVLGAPAETLFLGNAGTAVRFITGLAPLVSGAYVVDGDQAMRTRPMPGLLEALGSLGVDVQELGESGCPPVRLDGGAETAGDRVTLRAGGSSQELSALLLLGAGMPAGLEILVEGTLPSRPYVEMTVAVMTAFGVGVKRPGDHSFRVGSGRPGADTYGVEGDWTSVGYPLAAAWLTGKDVRFKDLPRDSVQGDRVVLQILEQLGRPGPRSLDLGDHPDLVPTVVACALFADGQTEIVNVAHLRIKESDRIGVLSRELKKLGAKIVERPDGMVVRPVRLHGPARLDPAGDHRLAMAFGLVSLRVPEVIVENPQCVSKSYRGFWKMLEAFS